MQRRDIVLAVLSSADGRSFTPVQLQKALFLLARNTPGVFDEGSSFNFQPYDYGPFDRSVYDEAAALAHEGLATVERGGSGYREYGASEEGERRGRQVLDQLPPESAEYIRRVAEWVRSLGFAQLVKSIYEAYPETRVNSIFQG